MGVFTLAAATPWYESIVSINPTTIVATLINTVIIMIIYRRFLHNKVMEILEKRKAAVSEEMDEATRAKEKALATEKEYLEKLSVSKEEAQRIVASATARATAKEEEIIAEATKEATLIKEKATESIEREKKRAVNEIKNQISELVIMTAQAVTEKEINENDNKALIESFLVKVGEE